jgi:hypothetical protein
VVRSHRRCGVLVLTLGATDYSWELVTGAGESFYDAGTARCTTPLSAAHRVWMANADALRASRARGADSS